MSSPIIEISSLPDISQTEVDFRDTSFFQQDLAQLPSPASIFDKYPNFGAGVIKVEEQNLAIKIGQNSELHLEEAQAIYAIRRVFPGGEVPVPELFGWRRHTNKTLIYMSLIPGPTLRQVWGELLESDKQSICAQLGQIVSSLQSIRQETPKNLIGSVSLGPVQDRIFRYDYEEGPFHSIKTFNDFLLATATGQRLEKEELIVLDGLHRDNLADNGNIYFTHGDLTLGNLIISGAPGSFHIAGVIDWEQAGWYPEYFEYCKLMYAVEPDHPWCDEGWSERVMRSFPNEFHAFMEYSTWRGHP